MIAAKVGDVIYPAVVILVDEIKSRAFLDTGSGSSSKLARSLEKKPLKTNQKQIKTMLHTTNTHVEIYKVQMTNVDSNFTKNAEVSKVNYPNLISLLNP